MRSFLNLLHTPEILRATTAMKKTIYILHGWAVASGNINQEKWQPFIDQLKSAGHTVVFLKIPGLSAPLNTVWNLEDFVSWLSQEIKERAQNQKIVLLGHSFGGQIAVKYVAQNSQHVEKLILLDSAGIRDTAPKTVIKRRFFLVAAKVGRVLFTSNTIRTLLYKLAREGDYRNAPPLLRRTMSNILDAEIVFDLPKISVPTKIIWGENDTVTPVKHAHQMHVLIKNSQLSFIAGARHSPQFTHTTQTARVVLEFIK